MKDEDRKLLEMWKVCTCHFCGNMAKDDEGNDIDFVLFGVEAHKKDPTREIIKICIACENDWISTYRR